MHSLAVYVKERLPFAQDLSLENSLDSYLRFLRALLYAVPYFFFLCRSPSSLLYTVYHSISFNIDQVLSINPPANAYVFGDFHVHHKDWPNYSGRTDRQVNSVIIFIISNDLTKKVNFPPWTPNCDSHIPGPLDLCLFADARICSAMTLPPLEILIMLLPQFPLPFLLTSKLDLLGQLMTILVLIGMVFLII